MVARLTSHRDLVAKAYDRAAAGFADSADEAVYQRLAVPLVEAVRRTGDLDAGAVLDVAAGPGAVGRYFPDVVAVDLSLEQLRRNPAPGRVVADGETLPFGDGSFAVAVSGFGVNHVAFPSRLTREMARVARLVGVSTWQRPELPYLPKQVVFDALARRCGRVRSDAGELVERYTEAVGNVDAISDALRSAGLEAEVECVAVDIPWPGVEAYLDYRLSMPSTVAVDDHDLRAELREVLLALPPDELIWRPGVIVGVGRR